ncbi:9290_t:CDS:2 [Ambispora gerdemannii]|uniref:9290_t:CDS:1 n=1 Tax=Ambispora gerdemannii TaxID=144530 RepID=A0A9N8VDK5_9GLOM|nr:9290_t:CDS:2 [Ambispora gerdemannii]
MRGTKRQREPDNHEVEGAQVNDYYANGINSNVDGGYGDENSILRENNKEKGKGKAAIKVDVNLRHIVRGNNAKRQRFEAEEEISRALLTYDDSSSSSSSSESNVATPISYSPPYYEQFNVDSNTFHFPHHYPHSPHKMHPIRISTRSNPSASSSELLNPYDNINSVLYLAHLMRNSHVVSELEEDLGDMEIDEPDDNLSQNSNEINKGSNCYGGKSVNDASLDYSGINSILREAFLRRRSSAGGFTL